MSHELELFILSLVVFKQISPSPSFSFSLQIHCQLFSVFSEVKEIKHSVIPLSIPILDVEIIAQHGRGVKRCH